MPARPGTLAPVSIAANTVPWAPEPTFAKDLAGPSWVALQAGVTPELEDRWVVSAIRAGDPNTGSVLRERLITRVNAMVDAGIPHELAGLYALAGYDQAEAVTLHRTQAATVATLQVEVELFLLPGDVVTLLA